MSSVSAATRGRIAVAIVFGTLIAVVVVFMVVRSAQRKDPEVPLYSIVGRTSSDGQELIRVEVHSHPGADGLRRIFDTIQNSVDTNGGHLVQINCATGATAGADNRLANGQFGVGDLGVRQTGLAEGYVRWKVNENRTCPVR